MIRLPIRNRWTDDRLPFLIAVACMLFMLAVLPAHAGEKWTRVIEVQEVTITVHVIDYTKLAKRQKRQQWSDTYSLNTNRKGYTELFRNRATGAFTCNIYVTAGHTAETIAHEAKHCDGWTHE